MWWDCRRSKIYKDFYDINLCKNRKIKRNRKMMEIDFIKADTEKYLEFAKDVYMEAFPENERKPFSMLVDGQEKGNVEILIGNLCRDDLPYPNGSGMTAEFKDEGAGEVCPAALIVLAKHADVILLDYFAVREGFRGRGVGADILRKLQERCKGKRLLLEIESTKVEAENLAQRLSRKRFYERCGMRCMDYSVDVLGVAMEVLTFGCEVGFAEYRVVYEEVYGAEIGAQVRLAGKEIR